LSVAHPLATGSLTESFPRRKPHCEGCDTQQMEALPWALLTVVVLYLVHGLRLGRRRRAGGKA